MTDLNLPAELADDARTMLIAHMEMVFEDMAEDITATDEARAAYEAKMRRLWPLLGQTGPHPLWADQSPAVPEKAALAPELAKGLQIAREADQDDLDENPDAATYPRTWRIKTYLREVLLTSEERFVTARTREEAAQKLIDGENDDAFEWRVEDTLSVELSDFGDIEEA